MSHWLDPYEKRFGAYAVPGLPRVLVVCQMLGTLLTVARPELAAGLPLIGSLVQEGEWWRLLTFVFVPESRNPLWAFFVIVLLWMFGSSLEVRWGTFRFNVFLAISYLGTVGAAFLSPEMPHTFSQINFTVFLAFAYVFPDFELWVLFLFPVKVRWLGLIGWALVAVQVVLAPTLGERAAILAPAAGFFALLGSDLKSRVVQKQRVVVREAARAKRVREPFHTCAVCGRTDLTHPAEEFRYRDGGLAYCSEHLGAGGPDPHPPEAHPPLPRPATPPAADAGGEPAGA